MSHEEQIVTTGRERSSMVPVPRVPVAVRVATMADFAFVDGLQRVHTDGVGWMPGKQLEGKIVLGQVLIAESGGEPLGYVMSCDRYFKRDDCGIIYQLNVVPDRQRGLIGATLIREVFERSAYGCKLYCCWCAQNLDANYFWESLGFIPLAFRTGARGKKKGRQEGPRTHIFWQRRIREGDGTTPYWFPSETTGGSMRENRLVLPIPPGTCWRDVMPVILPGTSAEKPQLEDKKTAPRKRSGETPKPRLVQTTALRGLHFAPVAPPGSTALTAGKPVKEKKPREKKPHVKNDPKHVAAARELRDRYLEQFNSGEVVGGGKYDVARALPSPSVISQPLRLPKAA